MVSQYYGPCAPFLRGRQRENGQLQRAWQERVVNVKQCDDGPFGLSFSDIVMRRDQDLVVLHNVGGSGEYLRPILPDTLLIDKDFAPLL